MVIRVIHKEKNTIGFRCSFDSPEAVVTMAVINADLKTRLFPPILMIMKEKSTQKLLKVKFLNKNSNDMEEIC